MRIEGSSGDVEMGGIEMRVSLVLTPQVRPGDHVIVHAGFAIAVMTDAEAAETLALLERVTAGNEA